VRRTVIVTLTTDKSFRGVLWERTREHLVLRNAELQIPRATPATVDGEVVIDRSKVEFIQVVSA
jgi:small nuclear ribonucleoprotein (snRNP)-like protein